jgi:hypothetical protein
LTPRRADFTILISRLAIIATPYCRLFSIRSLSPFAFADTCRYIFAIFYLFIAGDLRHLCAVVVDVCAQRRRKEAAADAGCRRHIFIDRPPFSSRFDIFSPFSAASFLRFFDTDYFTLLLASFAGHAAFLFFSFSRDISSLSFRRFFLHFAIFTLSIIEYAFIC